jgi:putative FmdB family regulatory protein
MPHYEFFCGDCKKFFDKILPLVDYEEGEMQCPHCDSKNVEQRCPHFPPSPRRRAPENWVRATAPKVVVDTGPLRA